MCVGRWLKKPRFNPSLEQWPTGSLSSQQDDKLSFFINPLYISVYKFCFIYWFYCYFVPFPSLLLSVDCTTFLVNKLFLFHSLSPSFFLCTTIHKYKGPRKEKEREGIAAITEHCSMKGSQMDLVKISMNLLLFYPALYLYFIVNKYLLYWYVSKHLSTIYAYEETQWTNRIITYFIVANQFNTSTNCYLFSVL